MIMGILAWIGCIDRRIDYICCDMQSIEFKCVSLFVEINRVLDR